MGRVIVHVDINSYFATLLQQENPLLRGRPVGVVKSEGRTCIIAASKEAKVKGVKTGCRLSEARKLAPEIIAVPASFERYLDCTRRLKKIFTSLAPTVDVFSLDEAFVDISDCSQLYPNAKEFGELVKDKIKTELGEWVSCNVGISYTRLLAKLASEVSPKGSVVEITPENKDQYLAEATFDQVCGIGFRLGKRLARLGVTHPFQIHFIPEAELIRELGVVYAQEVLRVARGEDSLILRGIDGRREQPMKSVGRTITGYQLCDDEVAIKKMLYNLTEEAAHKMRQMGMSARSIGVSLQGQGVVSGWGTESRTHGHTSQSWWTHITLKHHLYRTEDIFKVLYGQLYQSWQRTFSVIRYGVFLRLLTANTQVPIPLDSQQWRQSKATQAVDALNNKYGLFTVRSGALVSAKGAPQWNVIRPEVTGFLGDKQFYGL